MSPEQARQELAAIRRKMEEINERWREYSAEQRELQERYDAIECELNKQRFRGWLGQHVIMTRTSNNWELELIKPKRGSIGKLISVHRKYAIVDFGDLRVWKVPIVAIRSLDDALDDHTPPEAERVPGWRHGDELLNLEDEDLGDDSPTT